MVVDGNLPLSKRSGSIKTLPSRTMSAFLHPPPTSPAMSTPWSASNEWSCTHHPSFSFLLLFTFFSYFLLVSFLPALSFLPAFSSIFFPGRRGTRRGFDSSRSTSHCSVDWLMTRSTFRRFFLLSSPLLSSPLLSASDSPLTLVCISLSSLLCRYFFAR